jgi:tetratricopeptide (TPR) repeat protein
MGKNNIRPSRPRRRTDTQAANFRLLLVLLACSAAALMPANAAPAGFAEGVADYNNGKYARALSTFQAFAGSYPSNALVHYYIALSQQGLGHIDQAKSEYQWVVNSRDPKLAGQAAAGLAQLSRIHTTGSGAGSNAGSSRMPTSSPPPGGSVGQRAPQGKVSKILDFWATW